MSFRRNTDRMLCRTCFVCCMCHVLNTGVCSAVHGGCPWPSTAEIITFSTSASVSSSISSVSRAESIESVIICGTMHMSCNAAEAQQNLIGHDHVSCWTRVSLLNHVFS